MLLLIENWKRTVAAFNNDKAEKLPALHLHTVPKVIDFPRYNMKCSGGNEILSHSVSRVPLHFMIYRGNLEFFLDSAYSKVAVLNLTLLEWKCIQYGHIRMVGVSVCKLAMFRIDWINCWSVSVPHH